mmetsp:Transcript_30448/g.72453  ORF Transcript_30448/g.72453 Transcript_30448/m.72453 type:complete len:304 (-) Transcript_30448:1794-2705(-)
MTANSLGWHATCDRSLAAKSFRLNMKPSGSRSGSSKRVLPWKATFSVMIRTFLHPRLLSSILMVIWTVISMASIRSMSAVSLASMPLFASTSGSSHPLSHTMMMVPKVSSGSFASSWELSGSPMMYVTDTRCSFSVPGKRSSRPWPWDLGTCLLKSVMWEPGGRAAKPLSISWIVSHMNWSSAAPTIRTLGLSVCCMRFSSSLPMSCHSSFSASVTSSAAFSASAAAPSSAVCSSPPPLPEASKSMPSAASSISSLLVMSSASAFSDIDEASSDGMSATFLRRSSRLFSVTSLSAASASSPLR